MYVYAYMQVQIMCVTPMLRIDTQYIYLIVTVMVLMSHGKGLDCPM